MLRPNDLVRLITMLQASHAGSSLCQADRDRAVAEELGEIAYINERLDAITARHTALRKEHEEQSRPLCLERQKLQESCKHYLKEHHTGQEPGDAYWTCLICGLDFA